MSSSAVAITRETEGRRTKEEREEERDVEMLEAVVPLAGKARVESDERERAKDVLVAVHRVGVNMVGDVVLIAPREARAADEIIGKAENIVERGAARQTAVIGAVVERHANVCRSGAKAQAGQQRVGRHVEICSTRRLSASVARGSQGAPHNKQRAR